MTAMNIFKIWTTICCLLTIGSIWGQNSITEISKEVKKGDYGILEVRLNMEDEFRTLEGRDTEGMSRVALYVGNNQNKEVIFKGFHGYNEIVKYLNEMEANQWILEDVYTLEGNSLIVTHYVFRKRK